MTVDLRPYQSNVVADTRAALRSCRRVLICLPTGSGKTIVAAHMIDNIVSKGRTVWFLAHRDFLLDQTSQTFDHYGLRHSFVAAGRRFNPYLPVQVCSIGSLVKRLDRLTPPHVIITDEAHHAAAGSYLKILRWADTSASIGLSATPIRLDGKGLSDCYDQLVIGPTTGWLIQNGHLSDYIAYAPSTPDMTGVATRAGDYAADQVEAVMDRGQIIGDMVGHYARHARGLRAIYYGASVRHSEHIAASFNALGVPAAHVDGNTPSVERRRIARQMATGEILVVTNCSILTEGFDLSSHAQTDVCVECVGIARPTQSLALCLQMWGRGFRLSGSRSGRTVLLDHAGNIAQHGLPDEEREWTLEGMPRKKKAAGESLGVKTCMSCFGQNEAFRRECRYCGAPFAVQAPRLVEEIAGELQEIDVEAVRRAKKAEEWAARSVGELMEIGRKRGYAKPEAWAAKLWSVRELSKQRKVEHQARQLRMRV